MPFVSGRSESKEPPNKRRRLAYHTEMARYTLGDGADEKWLSNDDSTPTSPRERSAEMKSQNADGVVRTSNREELMECIKKGQKPLWIPTPGFLALCEEEEALREKRKQDVVGTRNPVEADTEAMSGTPLEYETDLSLPIHQIRTPERPRSALHRGDFSDELVQDMHMWPNIRSAPGLAITTNLPINASPPNWYSDSPRPTSFESASHVQSLSQIQTSLANRRRAPSLGSSLSSSFVMRIPTSPLVHAMSNPHLDLRRGESEPDQSEGLKDSSRRRTLPPNSFYSASMTPVDCTLPNFSRPFPPNLRREASMPCHLTQSRRSLSSFTYHPRSNPQTPTLRSRRPSMTSESGSRRRTSMVGSFEESILKGRMSTPSSKPLEFVAQIGVMGKGDCQGNLKCPAHVSVPFPAVFYNYSASMGTRSVSDDTPSPYVGTIDLDRNLKPVVLATKKGRKSTSSQNGIVEDPADDQEANSKHVTTESSKIAMGGAYRLPKQGQLQIILKNPNKTAVKLFLVPYDLEGMEAGTKTFVRQRSFSSGSIIESILSEKNSKTATTDPLENKQILRYLIHLKFCSPAKNRYYLHDDIRVVFANRVPDGKERLRNEIYLPEPRFTPYKPSRREDTPRLVKSVPSTPRHDSFELESPQFFGDMDGIQMLESPVSPTGSKAQDFTPTTLQFPLDTISVAPPTWKVSDGQPNAEGSSLQFPDIKRIPSRNAMSPPPAGALSPVTGFEASSSLRGSPILWRAPPAGNIPTRSFSPAPVEAGNGLLSKQFRELNGQPKTVRSTSSERQ